ncbi:MAG: YdcF family protein [Candidatus Kaiserbacteria bacterium]|nr:YdcF family protein [Candidatus Kaiserbacteria bacterium]
MSPREIFIAMLGSDPLRKADAIVVLEGDLLVRAEEGARLYKEGWAPTVVLSGGDTSKLEYAVPAKEMMPTLRERGVPKDAIVLEERSRHTRDQAVEVLNIAKERGWKSLIIVASNYHQYRAFLTFLKRMYEERLELALINAPARAAGWLGETGHGRRIDLLPSELQKIDEYAAKGHVATYEEGIEYLIWKESRP